MKMLNILQGLYSPCKFISSFWSNYRCIGLFNLYTFVYNISMNIMHEFLLLGTKIIKSDLRINDLLILLFNEINNFHYLCNEFNKFNYLIISKKSLIRQFVDLVIRLCTTQRPMWSMYSRYFSNMCRVDQSYMQIFGTKWRSLHGKTVQLLI